ncbi:O-antigen biosynthesis protein WbqV [Altererythrobacter atlanticus]|uniref:UDP-N-acetyl-alpha-D-glucosamine C6 dehydratase n=1 Tax=Croceibacterium atlanticum TaxID=1267766 RepID=A0A0F7KTC4_9SPHN|nr:nucleoside-diphosphate sugar epimerase/dehydratase [Croceibacterium atlanticum]AKH42854.1 UDP-N-acetyl-alpha-D-glucosamine C6 dehydratase [Croceibacterium atlanticum]MBB5731634.1 O-antigen biosynthesis protein WbqV [Croceibacterium atlanticum]
MQDMLRTAKLSEGRQFAAANEQDGAEMATDSAVSEAPAAERAPKRTLLMKLSYWAHHLLARFGDRRIGRLAIVTGLDLFAVAVTLQMMMSLGNIVLVGTTFDRLLFVIQFSVIVTVIFWLTGLYHQSWRFIRFSDCIHMGKAVVVGLVVAWLASVATMPLRWDGGVAEMVTMPIQHISLLVVVMGSMRIARRQLREMRRSQSAASVGGVGTQPKQRAIIVASPDWATSVIDLIRGDPESDLEIVGILLSEDSDIVGRLAGVPVLGGEGMLASAVAVLEERGKAPDRLILCDNGMSSPGSRSKILERAKKLDLEISRVSVSWGQLLRSGTNGKIETLTTKELLGRPEFSMAGQVVNDCVRGKRVLVTGAGGTIGGELVRQLAQFGPAEITLLDHAEHDLYKIDLEMRQTHPALPVRQAICSIRDKNELRAVFEKAKPEFVFHSAALKHVPIVEENPCAGVHTNVIGTRNVADLVCEFDVKAMVQVSTDKAVNPVGVMGASKRVGEIYCQALDLCGVDDPDAPRFITVRFGNVLGSSGSIVPLFKQQLEKGGPLTVTHPDITRYFMTVREAVQLILQSSAQALKKNTARGNIYVLDMGEPVRIYDLAAQMIRLAGYEPDVDVNIDIVGLRPGEKLYEELFDTCEEQAESQIPGIFEARSRAIPLPLMSQAIARLERLIQDGDDAEIRRVLHNLVRIPSGTADEKLPFGDFGELMADYARGNFAVVSSKAPNASSIG